MSTQKVLLLVTQAYLPDPTATGQYMASLAEAMVKEGWKVRVLAANRGYDNPSECFPARDLINGVEVRRLPFSSLGKKTILHRLVGQLSFCIQSTLYGLFMPRLSSIMVMTSPVMGGFVGWFVGLFRRRVAVSYWVMDINPDQAIELGKAKASGLPVRMMNWLNRRTLGRSNNIIALDKMMAERMRRKLPEAASKIHVIPPWPFEGHLERIEHADNPFRKAHGLEGKFVIMYSGNHSLVHPLSTVLQAAAAMRDDKRVVFVFIGGGVGKKEVDALIAEDNPGNIISLPYQPLDSIRYSLSAADVHLVSMGEPMVGIVHPCKFYGAIALAKPILLLGPENCHIAEMLQEYDCGWRVSHGDVAGAERLMRSLPDMPQDEIDAIGRKGRDAVNNQLSERILCAQLVRLLKEQA